MGLSFSQMKVALGIAIESGHVPNIVGLQGIGKSDLVREFSRENGYAFAEVTCSLIQEGDLAMPFISKNADGEQGVSYAINKIITNLSESGKKCKYAILFLDEFNRSSSQVQSELMNLVLQREVVGYKLADNVRVVLAMNPSSDMEGYGDTDYSVSYSDNAMLGRVISLDMIPSLVDWLDYGKRIGSDGKEKVHSVVRSYLSVNKDDFVTKEKSGCINNTPRGWARVSDVLYAYERMGVNNSFVLKNLLRGTINSMSADNFITYYKNSLKSIDYYSLALNTLNADSTDDWSAVLYTLNDAELDKLFKFMLECINSGDISSKYKNNITTFIMSVQVELAYSWLLVLERDKPYLYDSLLRDDDFAEFILKILSNSKSTEVGVFSGK